MRFTTSMGMGLGGLGIKECVVLVLLAVLLAGQVHLLRPADGLGTGWETVNIARTLIGEGRFANPFGSETGPTAQQPPAMPFLLAAILWVSGGGPISSGVTAWIVAVASLTGWLALLPVLSARFLESPLPGLIAALWLICVPTITLFIGWPEPTLVPLALVCFCLAPLSGWRCGAVVGMIAYVSPSALPIAGAWYLSQRRTVRDYALFVGTFIAVCLPWVVRNYYALGGFVPLRSNFGLELYVGNVEPATHPTFSASERRMAAEMGELAYMQQCERRATRWIVRHTRRFAMLTLERVRLFWFSGVSLVTVTLLSIPGLILAGKSRFGRFARLALLLYPLPFYFANASAFARYRCPMVWISTLLAGHALTCALSKFAPSFAGRVTPPRHAVLGGN